MKLVEFIVCFITLFSPLVILAIFDLHICLRHPWLLHPHETWYCRRCNRSMIGWCG